MLVSLAGIVAVHLVDLPNQLRETPYLGMLYVGLVAGCAVAAFALVTRSDNVGWWVGGLLAAATMTGYVLSRTTGLPAATGDIGNWGEGLGIAALAFETVAVGAAAVNLAGVRGARSPLPAAGR